MEDIFTEQELSLDEIMGAGDAPADVHPENVNENGTVFLIIIILCLVLDTFSGRDHFSGTTR